MDNLSIIEGKSGGYGEIYKTGIIFVIITRWSELYPPIPLKYQ
jgi:hypothetical protein